MNCGQCRHDNEPEAKFCSECGAPLTRACGSCGATQPPDAKFCNQCGNPMRPGVASAPDAGAGAVADAVPARSSAVRKNVTALFADLVGSTAFGEQVDPEAARAALAPYFDILRSAVEDRAGTVVKFTGDGVLAVFGIPEVAEDDALRAVATGVDLQHRFGEFAARIRERHGVELGLRVGINSGELVIADDDADLVGDVLNTAARLESECTPGRVLVGEDTWRSTRSSYAYEVLGEVRVKGKADPVATFQVVDGDAASVDEATPFVGRESEMQLLLDAFDAARTSPIARLVTVIGAPGVGKTRLAQELRAATRARSFDLRFERRGSTTFTPIADLLREVSDGTAEGVERLFGEHPERARLVPVLQSFLGHGEARSTEESFWASRRLLEHLTALHGPTVVVVDDIQWAEPRFWDLLDHLVEWAEAPVLIVALARPELRELRPELAQPGRRVAASIALEGLDATSTRELAARLLDTDDLPGELVERIPETTEGNPLFVRELVQMLVDDGTLARTGERWRLTIDVDAVEVPPTVLSLLATRVERLPDDERQLVELASVIGTEFDRGTLSAIIPTGEAAGLGAVIDRLRRKDLIEPSGAWAGDHPVYRFHHVLVRDAAYRRLLKGRRAELHEAVGRHLEQVESGGDDLDVTVAHHFEQVVRFRTELGDADEATGRLAKVAIERLRNAAETALSREDLPSAGGYATRALDLVDEADPARDELLVLACEALLSSGDVAGATPFVRELHERSTDERLAAWADCFRAERWSYTDADRLTEAADLTDDAAERLAALDDQAGVAKARLARAACLARLGRVGDCEQELDLALGAARTAGDRRRTVAVLGAAPLAALWGPSPVARAGGRCLDVLRLLRITTASPAVEATSVRCQGMLEALRGRFDSAREKLDHSRSTARELGLRHALFETELFAGFVELWAEDPSAAEPHLRAAHEGLGRLGLGADAGQAGALLARALHRQGRVDEAEPLAQDAVDSAGQNLQTAMEARAILAEVRALQGRHDEARQLVDEAIAVAERTDDVLDHALVALAGSRVATAAGDAERAARLMTIATGLLDDKGVTLSVSGDDQRRDDEERHAPPGRPDVPSLRNEPSLHNTASRTSTLALLALRDGDREGFIAPAADDFVIVNHAELDHSVWAHSELTRSEMADVLLSIAADATDVTVETIAIRGDDLCMARSMRHQHGMQRVFYHVIRTDDGLIAREDWFGPDQLCDAVEFLDDRHRHSLGLEPAGRNVWDRLRRAMFAGDRPAAEACLADDFVVVDHRRHGLLGERSKAEFVATTMPDDAPWYVTISSKVLREDDGCALVQGLALSERVSWNALAVAVDCDGLARRLEYFEPTDLAAATTRFDELVADRPDQRTATAREAPGDPLRNLATTPFGESLPTAAERGDLAKTDRLVHDDQLAQAPSRSDELTADPDDDTDHGVPPLQHPLEPHADRFVADFFDDSFDAIREEIFDPDFRREDRRTSVSFPTVDLDGFREAALALEGGPPTIRRGPVLAVRPNAYLGTAETRYADSATNTQLVVVVGGTSGRIARLVVFDEDQLPDALLELDARWLEGGGPPLQIGLTARGIRSFLVKGFDRDELPFADDFVTIDHRPVGMGRRNLSAFLESSDLLTPATMLQPQVFGWTDDLAFYEFKILRHDDEFVWHVLHVATMDQEGIHQINVFGLDQFTEAQGLYDELAGHHASPSAPPEPTNTAWELHSRFRDLATAGDWDLARKIVHGDYESTQRTPLAAIKPTRTGESAISHYERRLAGGTLLSEPELVAVRGDDLCLVRHVLTEEGWSRPRLVLVRSEDGLLRSSDYFDDGQLVEALDELDRLWVEHGGSRAFAELGIAARRSMSESDADALPFSAEFAIDDHRAFGGLGRRTRREFIETFELLTPSDVIIRQIFELTDELAFYEFRIIRREDGFLWHGLHVLRFDERGIDETHLFDPEQFDEARTMFDELTSRRAPHPPSGTTSYDLFDVDDLDEALARDEAVAAERRATTRMTNSAWELSVRFRELLLTGDPDGIRPLLASDYVSRDHQPIIATEDWNAGDAPDLYAAFQRGESTSSMEIVAVRGDDLCLGAYVFDEDGWTDRKYFVVRTEDGLIRSADWFDSDQRAEAMDTLDALWVELGGPRQAIEADRRHASIIRSGTFDDLCDFVAEDFESVDHRPLGFGRRSRDEWLESVREFVGTTDSVTSEYLSVRDPHRLFRGRLWTADGSRVLDGISLSMQSDDGRLTRFELFDHDQSADALARFDELTRRRPPPSTATTATRFDELSTELDEPSAPRAEDASDAV